MVNNLCNRLGHSPAKGKETIIVENNRLRVYDHCERCGHYWKRDANEEETKEYGSLLDYSANLKL